MSNVLKTIKDKARFGAIKGTSILLGTTYIAGKILSDGSKNLEAEIICKLDPCADKREVRRQRMESYQTIMKQIAEQNAKLHTLAATVSAKIYRKDIEHQYNLLENEHMAAHAS